jgi:outer membrane receptor protein involved in Fe transport
MKTKKDTQVRAVYASPCKLLTTGAALLLSATITFGQAVRPADDNTDAKKDDVVALEKYEVLGSRIKRLDTETASPVQVYTAESIKATGFTSLADVVRSLPFNNGQALTPVDAGTSFTPGVNSFNLRGLGNNNTLVLLNGRRLAPYATPGYDGFQTVFDLNSIPDAAIESMSILKDGGSALYGSDAVAGVVDFKLKQDFVGTRLTVELGNYLVTDGLQKNISLISGVLNGKTHIFVSANWREERSVYARDLSWSKDANKMSVAPKSNMRYESPNIPLSQYVPSWDPDNDYEFYSRPDANPFSNDEAHYIADQRSSAGYPGYVTVPGEGNKTFSSPTDNPTTAGAVGGSNLYNFQETSGLFPDVRRYSFYTRIKHEFTDWLYGFAEVSFNRTEIKIDAAPSPVFLVSEQGLTPDESMFIPSYNAYNPWGVNITAGARRLAETGNRINDVTIDAPRLLAGLGGILPGDWSWEFGALYSKNTATNLNLGSVADYRMQQALMGLSRAGDGSLVWDASTPQAERVYFNWFGLNEQAFADFLVTDNPNVDSLKFWNYDARASGSFFDLPGGRAGLAIGTEMRTEKLSVSRSDLNQTGNIVGGSTGSSSRGQREVNAIYAEMSLPVTKWFEAQLAGRWESYSDDGIKSKIRPKVGLKFKPLNWLVLRTSYSESFKAPDLAYLYTSALTTFSSSSELDPVTDETVQIQTRTSGNPDLKPETTDVYYGGVVLEPQKGFLRGLVFSFDYFYYDQKNLLTRIGDYYSSMTILTEAAGGNPLFQSMVVRDPATQTLLYIKDDYTNMLSREYSGFDFDLNYTWNTDRFGKFRAGVMGTYIIYDKLDGDNIAGSYINPRFNAVVQLNWKYRDWGVSLYETYIGERTNRFLWDFSVDDDPLYLVYDVKSQNRTNFSVTYTGFHDMEITLGATNVFNQAPPVDPYNGVGTTAGVNDPRPPFWYIRVSRDF